MEETKQLPTREEVPVEKEALEAAVAAAEPSAPSTKSFCISTTMSNFLDMVCSLLLCFDAYIISCKLLD